jgi:hypothetical protein
MAWGKRGLVPDCLGWLRVMREPEKVLVCKLWVAIGLSLLRFPWARGLDPAGPAR